MVKDTGNGQLIRHYLTIGSKHPRCPPKILIGDGTLYTKVYKIINYPKLTLSISSYQQSFPRGVLKYRKPFGR
jgi:hypothetical protein